MRVLRLLWARRPADLATILGFAGAFVLGLSFVFPVLMTTGVGLALSILLLGAAWMVSDG